MESATIITPTSSPRLGQLGIDISPVPMEVSAATIVFLVDASNYGISLRNAAVDAPEVITLISLSAELIFADLIIGLMLAICEEEEYDLA